MIDRLPCLGVMTWTLLHCRFGRHDLAPRDVCQYFPTCSGPEAIAQRRGCLVLSVVIFWRIYHPVFSVLSAQ